MPEPVLLREPTPAADPVEVPEVLLISALLATGRFVPEAYRVTDDEIIAYERVYAFCRDHQRITKAGPDIDLVQRRFPDFPYVPNVNPTFAAEEVHKAAYDREVRRAFQKGLKLLGAGDHDGVVDILTPVTKRVTAVSYAGVASTDPANAVPSGLKVGVPVPFEGMQALTDGVGVDELWFLAARFGVGKSWIATYYAARAAEAGCVARYVSTEMPAWKVNRRVNLHHARNDPALQNQLRSADADQRAAALEVIASRVPGRVETIDMTMTRMYVGVLAQVSDGAHIVFADHVGHLLNAKGQRAIEDWRIMGEISNTMMEIKNTTGVPLFGVVQINREGETTGWSTPKASKLSQSDTLGQDANVVITTARPNDGSVMIHDLRKYRDGPTGRIYTRYDPASVDFAEISKDQAQAQVQIDVERASTW